MPRFEHTTEIARPVDEVFAFVTEPLNYPRCQPSLVEVRTHRRGRLRRGSEVTGVRRFLGREVLRRAGGEQRLQVKWFAYACTVMLAGSPSRVSAP